MGRLSKKAIEEKKKARRKHVLTLALQSMAGAIIFSLLIYIIIGDPDLVNIIEFVQEKALEFKVALIALPISYIIIFICNLGRSFMLGELDK